MIVGLGELLEKKIIIRGMSFFALLVITSGKLLAHDDFPKDAEKIEVFYPYEVSGVAAVDDGYLVVGDEDSKHYFRWPMTVPPPELKTYGGPVCDAEAIDVAKGENGKEAHVVLSEDFRTVHIKGAQPITLPREFAEQCERGAEGLSVRWSNGGWDLVVLWEGGIPESEHELKDETRNDCRIAQRIQCSKTLVPDDARVAVYRLSEDLSTIKLAKTVDLKIRSLLEKEKTEEFFRATDITWFGNQWLVLLGSTPRPNMPKPHYQHTWIQGFHQNGSLDPGKRIKLEKIWGRYRQGKNWEALDTTDDGSRLVLGFDTEGPSHLIVFKPEFGRPDAGTQ